MSDQMSLLLGLFSPFFKLKFSFLINARQANKKFWNVFSNSKHSYKRKSHLICFKLPWAMKIQSSRFSSNKTNPYWRGSLPFDWPWFSASLLAVKNSTFLKNFHAGKFFQLNLHSTFKILLVQISPQTNIGAIIYKKYSTSIVQNTTIPVSSLQASTPLILAGDISLNFPLSILPLIENNLASFKKLFLLSMLQTHH